MNSSWARETAWGLGLAALLTIHSGIAVGAGASPTDGAYVGPPPERFDQAPGRPAAAESPAYVPPRGFVPFVQVNVNAGGNNIVGDAANEPSIAIDPTNPNRMAIGWRQFDTIASNFRQAGYGYSRDNGRTWTFPGSLTPGTFRSDPVLESSPTGVFYYNSLQQTFLCDVFRSSNGGETWPELFSAFGGDKAWMAADRVSLNGLGRLYQAWSSNAGCCGGNTFTRSFNGGANWMTPVAIPDTPIFGTLAVGPNAEVYVSGRLSSNGSAFRVARSTNAWDMLQTPTFTTAAINLGGAQGFGGGPNPVGLLGQVNVAVDTSNGARRGWVYLLCSVDPTGTDPLDVNFARSTNGGQTWSAPVRVNDDPPAANAWQWFGTMSVAPNGRIDVIWNDTRDDPNGRISQLYYSFSNDGGVSWSASEALTPAFDPSLGYPQQNKLGDYYHMISDNVGASLAFAATFNGEQDVYFMRIGERDCNGNGVADPLDISGGASTDFNGNNIPDKCDGLGDANCDGRVDANDVAPLALLLTDPATYAVQFPGCAATRCDINGSAAVNGDDLQLFVAVLLSQ